MTKNSDKRRVFQCACVQFDVRRADVAANRDEALKGLRQAAAQGAELAVLPEMWPTSFVPEPTTALIEESARAEEDMVRLSNELGLLVVGGGFEERDGALYNRALVVDRGNVLGAYRKIHLFTPNAEPRYLKAGDEPLILDTRLGRLGVLICYDIRFPELVRHYYMEEVEILAVPAQWPEARAEHWRTLLRARAIENQCFVVGCNRTGSEPSIKHPGENLVFPGDSRIVDPTGEVLVSGSGEKATLLAEIDPRNSRTMRRIVPVAKDRRPDVYRRLWHDESGCRL